MLPDLPDFRRTLRAALIRYVSNRAQAQIGVFNVAPKHIVHEGTAIRVSRDNGETEESDLMQASATTSLAEADAERLSHSDRMKILNDLADQLAGEMARKLYAALDDTLNRAGQTVDNRGRPLDAETIFAAFEKISIDFDSAERPRLPMLSMGPDGLEATKRAFHQIDTDPTLRSRFEALLSSKKAEWRDREAARKLVG